MPDFLKTLIYILIVATPALMVAGKIAVPFIPLKEFRLWRNCWLFATCAVFLSSNFYVFAVIMLLLCIFIHKHTRNPLELYIILMFVAPCLMVPLGIPGLIGKIVELDMSRLLALFILLPIAIELWQDERNRIVTTADLLIGTFVALICLLAVRDPLPTSAMRMIAAYILDIVLPYFVFSRALRNGHDVNRTLLAFAVAILPLAAIGIFEVLKGWRVYNIAAENWDLVIVMPYLMRDGMLRAAVTAIEPISFGFVCMTGAGCLLAIRSDALTTRWRLCALAILAGGLLASISRGPWLGFAVCCMIMALARPKLSLKIFCLCALPCVALAFASGPRISRFVNLLPFVGKADPGSETYRTELFRNASIVIERYPLFGSITFLEEPEMLRMVQGQGIIDLVNSYLQVSLEFGLVGLGLFAAYFAYILLKLFTSGWSGRAIGVSYCGLFGILFGMLFTITTTSSVTFIPHLYWAFSGVCAAALRIAAGLAAEGQTISGTQAAQGAFGFARTAGENAAPRPRILGKYRT